MNSGIYSLGPRTGKWQRDTWASGPTSVRRQVPDVRWGPVVWWLVGFRMSGTTAPPVSAAAGLWPCTLFTPHLPLRSPGLYILLHLHHLKGSVVIDHLRDRATLIHIGSPPCERPRPLRRRSTWIQDLLAEKIPSWIQDLLTEKNRLPLYRP